MNFFNKNLYQQMLFFVLPIYYASATVDSLKYIFRGLNRCIRLLSTADIVYDRHLVGEAQSKRRLSSRLTYSL